MSKCESCGFTESHDPNCPAEEPYPDLKKLNEVINRMIEERSMPWVAHEWKDLPEGEKAVMAEALNEVFSAKFKGMEKTLTEMCNVHEEREAIIGHLQRQIEVLTVERDGALGRIEEMEEENRHA